jgi:DNA-binding NarL/FixJ family response regulator
MKALIVDDHALIRAGLKQLCGEIGADVVEAENGEKALGVQKAEKPKLTILDLNMPGLSGLELLRQMLEVDPLARILVFSTLDEPVFAARALEIGAKGYVSKNAAPDELRKAIARVANNSNYVEIEIAQQLAILPVAQREKLSERHLEILRQLGLGYSFTEIAQRQGVSYKTIANAASAIKSKLGITRNFDLIRHSAYLAVAPAPHKAETPR